MRYGEVVTRSLHIFWHHRYLWLLGALGGGESVGGGSGGGGNYGSSFYTPGRAGGGSASGAGADFARSLQDWFSGHAGLLIVAGALLLVFGIAYFLVSCVASGALVRAAAEHDAERPFDFHLAWRAGTRTFARVLGLRLLLVLWTLVVLVIAGALVGAGVYAGFNNLGGLLAAVVAVGAVFVLAFIVVGIVLGLVYTLALRAIVLEERRTWESVRRGWQLFQARLGRVLLVWLIQIGVALVLGFAIGIGLFLLALPLLAIGFAAYSAGGVGGVLTAAVPLVVVFVLLSVAVGGAAGSYITTYWTLAYRRLDLDPVPAPAPAA